MPELLRQRHTLVWLAAGSATVAQATSACSRADPQAIAWLSDWVSAERPLVVARQEGAPPGMIRVGLPLPPSRGKLRLGFEVPTARVIRCAPPPRLEALRDTLPDAWQVKLAALGASAAVTACTPRVFGSVALQMLTGLPYVSDTSDLDLSLSPPDWVSACAAIDALMHIDNGEEAPRIDGEVLDPTGRAVCWRELASGAKKVLSKHLDGVALLDRTDFIATFTHAEVGSSVA